MGLPVVANADRKNDEPPRPRRWIPLSLFLTVLLLGIGGVMTGVRCYRQHVALLEIERVGAAVGIEKSPGRWLMQLVGGARARAFANGFFVHCGPNFTDADLIHMNAIPTLVFLDLSDTKITDAGLKHLAGLTSLQTLGLSGTKVTKAGVAELQQALPDLAISR